MARVVATLLGLDGLPGATVTRYCSSSLQTTRMAFHAIKAGEGDVFISAGVETVSRFARGNSDGLPPEAQELVGGGWENPRFAAARARTARGRRGRRASGTTRATTASCPTSTSAMGQTAENLAQVYDVTREDMDEFGVRSQNLAEKAIADGFWEREITPVTTPDGTVVSRRRRPPRRRHPGGGRRPQAGRSARTAGSPPATAARSTTAPPPW